MNAHPMFTGERTFALLRAHVHGFDELWSGPQSATLCSLQVSVCNEKVVCAELYFLGDQPEAVTPHMRKRHVDGC